MKKITLLTLTLALLGAMSIGAQAQLLLSDTFSGGTTLPGHIPDAGTTAWVANSGAGSNTPSIASGAVSLTTSGEDDAVALTSAVTSGSIFAGLDVDVTAAQTAGDYFASFNVGGLASSSVYTDRLFAKATTGGYLLGIALSSASATPVYGTTVYAFGTTNRLVMEYDFTTVGSLFVDPTGSGDVAIATITGTGGGTSIGGFELRQGTAASAPTETVDNLMVGTTLASVVPEPSTWAMMFGGLLFLGLLAKRRTAKA